FLAAAVPGELMGYRSMLDHIGTRVPWPELFNDAIHLARHGFPVYAELERVLKEHEKAIIADQTLCRESGQLDVDPIDTTAFCRKFRFHRVELNDLITGPFILGEVMNAKHVRLGDREALCMTLRRLVYPNQLCDF
ncbi:hypothetical protein MRX96_044512, partial [Rhipicephalus microplus]